MTQSFAAIGSGKTGTQYRTQHNDNEDSILTTHIGSSRPSYAKAGTIWINNSANPNVINVFDGTDDIKIGEFNTTSNVFTPARAALQDGSANYAADSGSTDTYAITLSPAISAYVAGLSIIFKANTANTGACTLNVNSLGAVSIKKPNGQDLDTGMILANQFVEVVHDGTNFVIQSPLLDMHDVNAQTGTTYTVLTGDRGKLVTLSNASSIAVTLPQAGSTFENGWYCDFQNLGVGTVTITPTTSTVDGAASITLSTNQGVRIVSDGSNYFTQRGLSSGAGMVHITSVTASNDATIDLNSIFSADYDVYMISGSHIKGVTDNVIPQLRVGASGTPKSGASDYGWRVTQGGASTTTDTSDNQIDMAAGGVGNDTDEWFDFTLWIYRPFNASDSTNMHWIGSLSNSSFNYLTSQGQAIYFTAESLTDLQFYYASGNVSEGYFDAWGIKTS